MRMSIEPQVYIGFPDVKLIKSIAEAMRGIVDEFLINVSQNKISITALDPAKVALIKIDLPSDIFLDLKVERDLGIGVSIESLENVLEGVKKTDKISLGSDGEFVEFIVEGLPSRRFKFRNIEIPTSEIPELDLDFDVSAIVLSDPFKIAVKDIAAIGNYIRFICRSDEAIELVEDDTRKGLARLQRETGSLIDIKFKNPAESSYDVSYLEKILKITSIASQVSINFGNNIPLKLDFSLVVGGEAEFYLAPRA